MAVQVRDPAKNREGKEDIIWSRRLGRTWKTAMELSVRERRQFQEVG